MQRPPSSAGPSRPFTSTGGRPGTARFGHDAPADDMYAHHPQYTYSVDEEYEDEESEPEDVFAYLPPTTAELEQQQQQQQQYQAQQPHPSQFAYSNPSAPVAHPYSFGHYPNNDQPPLHAQPTFPLPHNDPSAPLAADPHQSESGYPHHPHLLPAETPPSTVSTDAAGDAYRMHRLDAPASHPPPPAVSPGSGPVPPVIARTPSSREVHVSLPPTADEQRQGAADASDKARASDVQDVVVLAKSHQPLSSAGGSASSASAAHSVMDGSEGASIKMEFDFDEVEEEDSPYPEVRASVSNVDDPEMPAMTFRMWVIGLGLCMIGGSMNVFFYFRYPAPSIVPLVLLLVAYPLGKLMAYSLPITIYRLPAWLPLLGGSTFSFNPGPWNIKEHVLVFIMGNVAVSTPYALSTVVVADRFYGIKEDYWFALVLILATQLTGFGLAGMCRRFLVWPASMVWPQNLIACTLLNTLHAEDDEGTGGISRYKFYMWAFAGSFFFFFFPGYIFQALSVFSWVCWIVPKNVPVNQLFGVSTGLGMSVLTFDWTQISYIGSPLMVPWWAEAHIFCGFVLFYWIFVPAMYYTNTWKFAHFPLWGTEPYDKFGEVYNISRVLTDKDTFDVEAFENYSPLYLTTSYATTYLLAFALSTCVIVHTILYDGKRLLNGFKRIRVEKDDIHAKLMRNYPEVPDWWYALVLVFFFSLAIVACEVWKTGVPVWALLLAILLPTVYIIPNGFIFAMTGQGISVNLLAQIIPGTLLPGKPLANMVFKAYALQTMQEAQMFTQDLKLGHYIKVPPRATFIVQMVATTLAAFVQVGIKEWMFANIPDICHPKQASNLTCPHNRTFYTASAVWGLIGPSRQFGKGSLYHPQLYAIAVGAVLPIPFWLWKRRNPRSWVRHVNTPVLLNGVMFIPPATGINYSSWFMVGFIFQFFIRRRNFPWWSRFNYVLSAALDSGTAISLIVIFFTLQFPRGGSIRLDWWGNSVFTHNADYNRPPWKPLAEGQTV